MVGQIEGDGDERGLWSSSNMACDETIIMR